jgi:hypothetical protein
MTVQHLTLIAQIKQGQQENLRNLLLSFRAQLNNNQPIGLETTGTTHFARWTILDEWVGGGQTLPARVVFLTNFDGDPKKYLEDLITKAPQLMDAIYNLCENYPATTPPDKAKFLLSLDVKAQAFYPGAPGRSLQDVLKESSLRNYIRDFVVNKDWKGKSSREIHQEIRRHVFSNDEFQWAKKKKDYPKTNWFGLIGIGLILLLLLPLIIIWIVCLQFFKERKDIPLGLTPSQLPKKHEHKMEEYEDLLLQNQFSQVMVMKPGFMRLVTLKGMFLLTRGLVSVFFIKGKLMGIPTIHFARWVLIDNNKRLLFCSNYDGSWQQYLGDFIDKSGWGLTGIFGNTVGFPKSLFMFFKGAYDEEHFLAWSRYYQVETQVWYTAYPQLSIKNVINNSAIRQGIAGELNEADAAEFLRRI